MATIFSEPFGFTKNGRAVTRYTLQNAAGMRVCVLDYGCTVQSIFVPDRAGKPRDVALGYDTVEEYEAGQAYFGAFVGRCANRIKDARFTLDGREYRLEKNDGENHLHGIFARSVFFAYAGDALYLHRGSPDGEEGYPGTLEVRVCYRLRADNALEIIYDADTDADTIVNFTNHTYFNLNGQDGSDVLSHELTLLSDRFLETGAQLIPTGAILPVGGTPMDFRRGKALGSEIDVPDRQLLLAAGYDHSYVIGPPEGRLRRFAAMKSRGSGISMEAFTTEPAVQLYTANDLRGERGKGGVIYPRRGGVCLETQHYPASPAFAHFPSIVLRANEHYHSETVFRFGIG